MSNYFIEMSDKQRTLKQHFSLSGQGLHTGASVTIRFNPAAVNTGIVFKRTDLEEQPEIKARVEFVTDTMRGTTLGIGDVKVHTVEHALSALTGCGVDNVLIELDGPEVPILDGSAMPFTAAILEAGTEEQTAARDVFVITEPIRYKDPETGSELVALPSDSYEITTIVDFRSVALPTQYASFTFGKDDYASEIARCRTFTFLHELEMLMKHNLIQGGDLSNAIVFAERMIDSEILKALRERFNLPEHDIAAGRMINTEPLRYENEPARHKLLDVIGDLSLAGVHIQGHILATKPGHKVNTAFARLIAEEVKKHRNAHQMPYIDLNKKPLYDIYDILKILPHRFPFLLVDKILEMNEQRVVGVKNVTMNEPFFTGHFPGNPVMPGVMMIESIAQVGGILVMNTLDNPSDYTPYFIKVDNVKFKRKVSPGDTLVFFVELVTPIRRGICHMRGVGYVDGKPVMVGEMMAKIVKNDTTNN